MSSFHTLNSSEYARWLNCRMTLASGDLLLLIEDAVYGLEMIQAELPMGVQLYCLHADVQSRGLESRCPQSQVIDYNEWVKLCCDYQRHISW